MLPLDKEKLNKIAKLEKAVKDRWGDDAIQTPQSTWTDEKELDYKKQTQQLAEKLQNNHSEEKIDQGDFFITKRLLSKESKTYCKTCDSQIRTLKDEVYDKKWDCCYRCFINYIEDREERWKKGWRPNADKENTT